MTIRVPNGIKHRDRRLREGEFEKLQEAAKLSQNIYLWPMVKFAIYTAMRRSEILSLRWENVSMLERVAHLVDTKNGTARRVPLSSEAISVLKGLPPRNRLCIQNDRYGHSAGLATPCQTGRNSGSPFP